MKPLTLSDWKLLRTVNLGGQFNFFLIHGEMRVHGLAILDMVNVQGFSKL